jgi:hypothetical protein
MPSFKILISLKILIKINKSLFDLTNFDQLKIFKKKQENNINDQTIKQHRSEF